nr:MAG TPA: hypothetical protein [Caudoviricetes sp.]
MGTNRRNSLEFEGIGKRGSILTLFKVIEFDTF